MKKYDIQITADNCTGCLRCALACSNTYTQAFNAPAARIRVDISDTACAIHFTDECNACGICVDNCFYDALQKQPREAAK
jgi:ferredoxin